MAKRSSPRSRKSAGAGQAGVQAMETGLTVLQAFVGAEPVVSLKSLAERTGMSPPKVHRYLVSLCRTGFVHRDPLSALYSIGHSALRLGTAAIANVKATGVAAPVMAKLRLDIAQTVVLAVWSAAGATVVLEEVYSGTVTVTSRVGTILPCLTSATGRMFCAFLPRDLTEAMIARELATLRSRHDQDTPTNPKAVESLLAGIRERGMARTLGGLNPDISALSAPIFEMSGQLSAVLCALGPARSFDADWKGPIARKLAAAAASLSRSTGYQAATAVAPAAGRA